MATTAIVVPLRNERYTLAKLLRCIDGQTTPPHELLLIDGASEDGTFEFAVEAAATRPSARVLRNPNRTIPSALNIGLAATDADVIIRMDAHAHYPANYIETVLATFKEHPEVSGVGSQMTTAGHGVWGRAIASVLSRPIGLGGARHRIGGEGGSIEHVFSGAYVRDRVLEVGAFNEALLANEDYELDFRLRKAGGTLWMNPLLRTTWFVRESPTRLVRQMWRYGYYKALTLRLHPESIRLRQSVPPALVAVLFATTLRSRRLGAGLALAYLMPAGVLGARAGLQDRSSPWRAAVAVPLTHLSWGSGLLVGTVVHRLPATPKATHDPSIGCGSPGAAVAISTAPEC